MHQTPTITPTTTPDPERNGDPDSEAAIAAAYAAMAADPETHLSYEHARRRRQQHAHHYIRLYSQDEPGTQLPPQDPTMTDQPDDSARGTTEPSAPPTGPSTSANVCGIDATVWWAIAMDKLPLDDLTPDQLKTIARIRNEVPD